MEDPVGKKIWRYEKEAEHIFNKLMGTFNTDSGLEHTQQYMECTDTKDSPRW